MRYLVGAGLLALCSCFFASTWAATSKYVIPESDGSLRYVPYNDKGDTIADYSHVGFRHSAPIPHVPVVKTVKPVGNKASDVANIQQALNSMSDHPVNSDGFRGAVLLEPGEYNIDSSLHIGISGVILRGSGPSTVLYGSAKKQYDLITAGNGNADVKTVGNRVELSGYIKMGTKEFHVPDAKSKFKVGERVLVAVRRNENWIKAVGMDKIVELAPANVKPTVKNWSPFDSRHPKIVTEVNDNSIKVNVPMVEAIDPKWGGGYITGYEVEHETTHVGVEDMCSYSYFDAGKTNKTKDGKTYYSDENHAQRFLYFHGVIDGFARRICGKHFNYLVSMEGNSQRITVSNAAHKEPVSIITPGRRGIYQNLGASQVLFEHCHSSGGRHAFGFGSYAPGPNVFYNCTSDEDYATSEPHSHWSVGGLYDNCKGLFAIYNRLWYGDGHGWGGANFVAWNTEGALQLQSPVTEWNFAIGHVGEKTKLTFPNAPGSVDRTWESYGTHVQPKSLFLAQLAQRQKK